MKQVTELGGGFTVGGVALVAVDLDNRALIEQRAVIAVVFVGVIGANAMGVGGGDQ